VLGLPGAVLSTAAIPTRCLAEAASDERTLAALATRPSTGTTVPRDERMIDWIPQRLSDELGPRSREGTDSTGSAGCAFELPP
jgi:hypothetical protein